MRVSFSMIARGVLSFFVPTKVIAVFFVRLEPLHAPPFKKRRQPVGRLIVARQQEMGLIARAQRN